MMQKILLIALAITAACVTFVMIKKNTSATVHNATVAAVQTDKKSGPMVLVAAKTMSAGTFINESHLRWQEWPADHVAPSYLTQDKTKMDVFNGAVNRRAIAAGEPVTEDRLVKPGDRGFMAAILGEGKRAVSVQVNATTSVGGLVFPGDHVDVILTHTIKQSDDEDRPMRQVSETIISDVRVVAMDQRTDDQNAQPVVPKTATLEVSPKQAEILAVSSQLGRLSLALRALSDTAKHTEAAAFQTASFTLDGDASHVLSADMKPKKVHIVRGGETEEVLLDKKN